MPDLEVYVGEQNSDMRFDRVKYDDPFAVVHHRLGSLHDIQSHVKDGISQFIVLDFSLE